MSAASVRSWDTFLICALECRAQYLKSITISADNGLGGWYSYRLSKAALNQATVTCARELRRQRTICVALHPGTTDTGLSKPFQARVAPEKLFPVEFTASQLLDIVDGLEEDDSGRFIDWAGIDVEY